MITLYTTHCPLCKLLKKQLDDKGISYELNDNVDDMLQRGFKSAPMLEVNGEILTFSQAGKFVENYGSEPD